MSSWKAKWIALIVSLAVGFRLRSTSALSHHLAPLPGTSNALSLALYVKSSIGEAYFVAVPSSAKVIQTTVTAEDVVDPSRHVVFKANLAQSGSFPVQASKRSIYVIEDLVSGEAYDVFFVIEATNSSGLFSPVNRVLGVSTNGAAPPISGLSIAPVDARTDAIHMSFSMDAPGVACRLWYVVLPLRDGGFLEVDQMSAREIFEAARPDGVIDLPQGLKGEHSPRTVIESLESDTWYQVSAVSERATGVFSRPSFTVARTHREPARLMDLIAAPVQGSTNSLRLRFRLDCSVVPTREMCGKSSYRVMETMPRGSPRHMKPREVAQGDLSVLDGQEVQHDILGLSPGKTYNITVAVETPDSNGVHGPSSETLATTFPDAPILSFFEILRSDKEPSTVIVRFRLSSPGIIHISLSERLGHPLAMRDAKVGNQHGVSFSREVGLGDSGGDDDDITPVLEGSQELNGFALGSAFDVAARTEATSLGHQSGVYGVPTMRVVEAVPPSLTRVRLAPLDATTSELVLEYQVRGTAGRMYYTLSELEATAKWGKESFVKSIEAIKSAKKGQGGIVTVGSVQVFPEESEGGSDAHGEDFGLKQLKFQELKPARKYVASLFTESNSGSISPVLGAEAETHAEAPMVTEATAVPVDGSAEALSLSISLESSGLVYLVIRRAGTDILPGRDHNVVYKGLHEANLTLPTSDQRPRGGKGPGAAKATVVNVVEGLEPNSTYEIFIVTESKDSNGVFWAKPEPVISVTHPRPSGFRDVYARAADASSSAIAVTVSLTAPAEVHYALFPTAPSGRELPSGELENKKLLRGVLGPGEKGIEVLVEEHRNSGCANATLSRRGAASLNETAELVTSGIVPFAPRASLPHRKAEAAPPVASIATSNLLRLPWKAQDLEVMFRVERLEAAKSYDVCLFTETPGSSGLFSDVYELQDVSTHVPVPELVSERVACTLDCRQLNRDTCWLEANRCGECLEGFIGKAGHANSLCGKPYGQVTDKPNLAPGNLQGKSVGSQLLIGVPVDLDDNVTKFLYVDVPEGRGAAIAKAGFDPQTGAAHICADLRKGGNEPPHVCVTSVTSALTSRLKDGRFHVEDDKERPVLQVEVETPRGEWLAFILRHGQEPGAAMVAFCRKHRPDFPDEQACVNTLKREADR